MERRGRKRHARRDRAGHAGRVEGRAARRHELPGAEGNSGYASLRGHGGGRCATVASVLPAATVSRRPVRLERRAGRVAGIAIRAPTRANDRAAHDRGDRKSTRLNSSHVSISYAVFCLKKKKTKI